MIRMNAEDAVTPQDALNASSGRGCGMTACVEILF